MPCTRTVTIRHSRNPDPNLPQKRHSAIVDGVPKDTDETNNLKNKITKKQKMWDKRNETNFSNLTIAVEKAPLANQIVKAY